jgi:hypothetical protein
MKLSQNGYRSLDWGSSVSVVSDYTLHDGVQFLAETKDFSSSLRVQTSSEAHPASYPMGTRGPFARVKCNRSVMLTTPSNAKAKNEWELYFLSPLLSAWQSWDSFTFPSLQASWHVANMIKARIGQRVTHKWNKLLDMLKNMSHETHFLLCVPREMCEHCVVLAFKARKDWTVHKCCLFLLGHHL